MVRMLNKTRGRVVLVDVFKLYRYLPDNTDDTNWPPQKDPAIPLLHAIQVELCPQARLHLGMSSL